MPILRDWRDQALLPSANYTGETNRASGAFEPTTEDEEPPEVEHAMDGVCVHSDVGPDTSEYMCIHVCACVCVCLCV